MVRNASRFHEVIGVALKYGLAPWLSSVRADWIQRHLRGLDGQQISQLSEPERVRMALTELGTTFIKLGQILSTRPDLIGPEIAEELKSLQSGTPADHPEQVIATVLADLGRHPNELFREFDPSAFASASIGQVHRATLEDGTPVVVKVQHSGIEERIQNDLEILMHLAGLAETYSSELAQYRPVAIAAEFRRTMIDELDFTREQRNLTRFGQNFRDDPSVCFPAPHPERCSKRVLTMDALQGISLCEGEALAESGFNLSDIARRGGNMFLQMVFRDGFYHADPHPGNLMILNDAVIGVLDCGMIGRVDEALREQMEDLLIAAVDRDAERLMNALLELGEAPASLDRGVLRGDLLDYVDDYGSQALDDFDLSGALNAMVALVRRHRILLPSRVSLLIKMLIMLEGTSGQLSPEFSIVELLEPYRLESIKRRMSPQRILRKVQNAQRDWMKLAESFPADIADFMERVRKGSFDVNLEHRRLDSIVNRLVLGILSAALFVGSASLMSNNVKPLLWETSVPGALGCFIALVLGLTLLRAMRKSGSI